MVTLTPWLREDSLAIKHFPTSGPMRSQLISHSFGIQILTMLVQLYQLMELTVQVHQFRCWRTWFKALAEVAEIIILEVKAHMTTLQPVRNLQIHRLLIDS